MHIPLTRFTLQIPLGTLVVLGQFLGVSQVPNLSWIDVTNQLLSDLLKVIFWFGQAEQKVLLGTLLHADLRRWTAIDRRRQVHALGQVQEDQIGLVYDGTVHATLSVHRVRGQDQSLGLSVLVRVDGDSHPCRHESDKQEQAENVGTRTLLTWSFEVRIEFQGFTC